MEPGPLQTLVTAERENALLKLAAESVEAV